MNFEINSFICVGLEIDGNKNERERGNIQLDI
jgi:hypothetical protein